jgi:hypothetical protein
MTNRPVGVTDTANADAVVEVAVQERGDASLATTTTADPGSGGTTLAVTSAAKFPASGNYKIQVDNEIMRVTGGQGTTSWTVTRGIDGTTAVAHTIGVPVKYVTARQFVIPISERDVRYMGRFSTFKTPGRAAVQQKAAAIHNATGSPVLVAVKKIKIDMLSTVAKAVTVVPPVIRICRFTALPTNGTAMTKVPVDTALTSSASVTVWGDASADGTGSATTLTITQGAVLSSVYAPRMITAAGYEMMDREVFFEADSEIILRALEGVVVFLDAAVITTGNPATDQWIISMEWDEFVLP